MVEFLYIILLSLIVFAVDYRRTICNMNVPWNGLGAVQPVLDGKSVQPMQYRVFVPLLCKIFGLPPYRRVYLVIKYIGILAALGGAFLLWRQMGGEVSLLSLALLSLFFCLAAQFDYADTYWEFAFFAFALVLMGHDIWVFLILLFFLSSLAALNRETAIFIPVIAFLSGFVITGFFCLGGVIVGLLLPRLEYGPKKRYCPFSQWRYNLWRWRVESRYLDFAVLSLLMLWFVIFQCDTGAEWGFVLLFLALLTPSIWSEIRVFAPCMLVLIPAILVN